MTERSSAWADGLADPLVSALETDGLAVFPEAVPAPLWQALGDELQRRDQGGELRPAGIGRAAAHRQLASVRRDRTCWLDGHSAVQQELLDGLERLRVHINRGLYLGLAELEAQFAIYEGGGFYRRHLDAFGTDNQRVVSLVLYLNRRWQPEHGGQLRLWPTPDAARAVRDVAPEGGTLVCFLSEQIPHEVLPATGVRYSIAGWFRRNR